MRLCLKANSQKEITYTPEWLRVCYKEKEQELELTLDIRGEISYKEGCFDCDCKVELIPWVMFNHTTGEDMNFEELSEMAVEEMFPISKIIEIIKNGTSYEVGIYPVIQGSSEKQEAILKNAEGDTLSECSGIFCCLDDNEVTIINFEFETQLNIY